MNFSAAASSSLVVTPARPSRRASAGSGRGSRRRPPSCRSAPASCGSIIRYTLAAVRRLDRLVGFEPQRRQRARDLVADLVGRGGTVDAAQQALAGRRSRPTARSSRGTARAGGGSPRACRRRGRSSALPSTSQTPSARAGRTRRGRRGRSRRRCGGRQPAHRPPRRRRRSGARRSARGRVGELLGQRLGLRPVRGKPSRMKPSAASAESIRSAITPTITSSGTRSPRSMYSLAVRPSSVSSRTAARRMSPVA